MAKAGNLHAIKEFRIVLPMECEEYKIGQLYSVAEASKQETGGGEGVEVIKNEPFDLEKDKFEDLGPLCANGQTFTRGQYTHKVYHLKEKVPLFIRMLAPKGALEMHEKAWNAYPYCRTIVSNPDYMRDNFYIVIETFHAENDMGDTPNIHGLSGRDLDKRVVVDIDIVNDPIPPKEYKAEYDPSIFRSEKANRGPFKGPSWKKEVNPVMCCYKLVKVLFKWWGLQTKVESFILKNEHKLFRNFHRQVVCWMDMYHGMTIEEIRKYEEDTKHELESKRHQGCISGTLATD